MKRQDARLMKDLKGEWTTARGVARWAKRHIGWHYGKLANGESWCVASHWDESHRRVYVSLLVYGSGPIQATPADVKSIQHLFQEAS